MVNKHLFLISQFYMLMWTMNKMDASIFTKCILDSNKDFIVLSLLMRVILENKCVFVGWITAQNFLLSQRRWGMSSSPWDSHHWWRSLHPSGRLGPSGCNSSPSWAMQAARQRPQQCLKQSSWITNITAEASSPSCAVHNSTHRRVPGEGSEVVSGGIISPVHVLLSPGNTSLLFPFKAICFRGVTNIFFPFLIIQNQFKERNQI